MPSASVAEAPVAADIEAEGRLLDVVLGGYEGDELDLNDPRFINGLRSVCDELLEEGRRESVVEDLLRGVLIDAEALKRHISESPPVPTELGRAQPLNTAQIRFVSTEMMKAMLPYISSDGSYDLARGAEHATFIHDQLCKVGYDSATVKFLAAEALATASASIVSMTEISPETFDA